MNVFARLFDLRRVTLSMTPPKGGSWRYPPLAPVAALLLSGCGGLAPEVPASWEDEFIARGVHAGLPEPGPRPTEFKCTVETNVGPMTVTSEPDLATGVLVIGAGGVVMWGIVPWPSDEIVSWDLVDGTDVYLIGDLLVFDGASNRVTDPGCDYLASE